MKYIFLLPALLLLITGCAAPEKVAPVQRESEIEIRKVDEDKKEESGGFLAITPVGDTAFFGGMPAMITIAVRNVGKTVVDIPTWHALEEDNIRFHYIKCDSEGNIPSDTAMEEWTTQKPRIKTPVFYPVSLYPENTLYIRGELCFIDTLAALDKTEYYLVIIELNQEKFHLASQPFVVTIVPVPEE